VTAELFSYNLANKQVTKNKLKNKQTQLQSCKHGQQKKKQYIAGHHQGEVYTYTTSQKRETLYTHLHDFTKLLPSKKILITD